MSVVAKLAIPFDSTSILDPCWIQPKSHRSTYDSIDIDSDDVTALKMWSPIYPLSITVHRGQCNGMPPPLHPLRKPRVLFPRNIWAFNHRRVGNVEFCPLLPGNFVAHKLQSRSRCTPPSSRVQFLVSRPAEGRGQWDRPCQMREEG